MVVVLVGVIAALIAALANPLGIGDPRVGLEAERAARHRDPPDHRRWGHGASPSSGTAPPGQQRATAVETDQQRLSEPIVGFPHATPQGRRGTLDLDDPRNPRDLVCPLNPWVLCLPGLDAPLADSEPGFSECTSFDFEGGDPDRHRRLLVRHNRAEHLGIGQDRVASDLAGNVDLRGHGRFSGSSVETGILTAPRG
jgi:hypothetical protein